MAEWECYQRSDGSTLGLNYRNTINGQTWVCGQLQGMTSVQEVPAWLCEKKRRRCLSQGQACG